MIERRDFSLPGKKLHIAFTGKAEGNMSPGYGADSTDNESKVLNTLGLAPSKLTRMGVNGGDETNQVTSSNHQDWIDGDALFTNELGQVLALYPGDCIPLVLWSEEGELCLAHLGRQGAQAKLASKVVSEFKAYPSTLKGWIGPSIRVDSYIFDDKSYAERFDDSWKDFTFRKGEKNYVDLTEYVLNDLEQAGMNRQNISIEPIDNGADENYFSHYREKSGGEKVGRNGIFIWIS